MLSGLLCNYFFGHIEKRLLGDVLGSPHLFPPLPSGTSVRQEAEVAGVTGGEGGHGEEAADDRHCEYKGDGTISAPAAPSLDHCVSPRSGAGKGAERAGGRRGGAESVPAETSYREAHGARAYRTVGAHPSEPSDGGGGCCESERCWPDGKQGSPAAGALSDPFPHPEGDCTLLRQVDDFLLVSKSKAKAEAFVRVMHDSLKTEEWGFNVHEAKVGYTCMVAFYVSPPSLVIRCDACCSL